MWRHKSPEKIADEFHLPISSSEEVLKKVSYEKQQLW